MTVEWAIRLLTSLCKRGLFSLKEMTIQYILKNVNLLIDDVNYYPVAKYTADQPQAFLEDTGSHFSQSSGHVMGLK